MLSNLLKGIRNVYWKFLLLNALTPVLLTLTELDHSENINKLITKVLTVTNLK